jgi:hypothetical protein
MRAMAMLAAVLLATPGAVRAQARAAPAAPSKNALTAKSWEGLHKLLLPQQGDYPWEQVTWYASLYHARKKAAAEDKPILVFGTGGAGFNDPLGNC